MTPALHFVGFRDDAFSRARKIFGTPDFVHRHWDRKAIADVSACDTVIFASDKEWRRFTDNCPRQFSFNDSEHF